MSADLAVQVALRARLVGSAAVTALVPASAIVDAHERPVPAPRIVLGETQEVDPESSLDRSHLRIYHTVHVWVREPSTEGAKRIVGAIRTALRDRLVLSGGYHCADMRIAGSRILRDPGGDQSHGVMTVDLLVSRVA